METRLKAALGVHEVIKTSITGGGCINSGCAYRTDKGMVFVKMNPDKSKAHLMFQGEYESLKAIMGTSTVRVPKPLAVVDDGKGGKSLVMEYLDMSSLSKYDGELGTALAKLHLHNKQLKGKDSKSVRKPVDDDLDLPEYVDKFGFHETTCCGYIPLDNSWKSDWVEFFAQQRLELQIRMIERNKSDKEVRELWSSLQLKLPSFFEGLTVYPSLLHGDLWSGNAAEMDDGPVIFDPASFYGHSEFDLSIAKMFGGFSKLFFESYHKLIPKEPGFDLRLQLYQLFHYLNHWNHFGGGYRSSSISIMRKLLKE